MSGKESHDVHESEEVFKTHRNASWVKSRELAESWPRAGRELAESWPVRGTHSEPVGCPTNRIAGLGFINNYPAKTNHH